MRYPTREFIVLVPEQFTMQTQKDLVSMHPRKGIMNIDIVNDMYEDNVLDDDDI